MPRPRDNETKGEFMGRCMDDEESKRDFPDRDQRLAFCLNQWERKDESADE